MKKPAPTRLRITKEVMGVRKVKAIDGTPHSKAGSGKVKAHKAKDLCPMLKKKETASKIGNPRLHNMVSITTKDQETSLLGCTSGIIRRKYPLSSYSEREGRRYGR